MRDIARFRVQKLPGRTRVNFWRCGQVQEMKVNFETEMATVQRLLETQQLNLQAPPKP